MAIPIRHHYCGAIVLWYFGPAGKKLACAADVLRVDGSTMEYGAAFHEICPRCKWPITSFAELTANKREVTH